MPRRNMLQALRVILGAAAIALVLPGLRAQAGDMPVIAVASSLQFAIGDITTAFAEQTGTQVSVALGASGNLARQIRQGAPFEVFLAADEEFTAALARDGFTQGPRVVYAEGRLALFVPEGSPLGPDADLDDLAAAISEGRVTRLAIANPDHAPYGARAREALETMGVWAQIAPLLVMGETVAQAARFAASGNAEGGLIAASLARAPELGARGTFALVPADLHAPLRQEMVLLDGAGMVAEAFFTFMTGRQARAILAAHGLEPAHAPG